MKLILFTQRVDTNDTNLGFFTEWLRLIAKHCSDLTVVCWSYSGEFIADNTRVIVIKNKNIILRILEIYYIFFINRKKYDKIFVHMLPEIVVLLLPIKIFLNKNIYLWYTHKAISKWLVVSEIIVKKIFSASKESFNLTTEKLFVFGHGIKTNDRLEYNDNLKQIVTLGRVAKVKKIDTLIKAIKILNDNGFEVNYDIIGPCLCDADKKYFDELKKLVNDNNLNERIRFLPAISYQSIERVLQRYSIFIHQCQGGLDKAPLEAMAFGLLVFSSNKSVADNLRMIDDLFVFAEDDECELADKIKQLFLTDENKIVDYRKKMKEQIKNNHSLERLISKIVDEIVS